MHSNSIASRIDRGELGQVIRVAVIRDDAGAVDVDVRVSMKLKYSVDAGIVASHHDCPITICSPSHGVEDDLHLEGGAR